VKQVVEQVVKQVVEQVVKQLAEQVVKQLAEQVVKQLVEQVVKLVVKPVVTRLTTIKYGHPGTRVTCGSVRLKIIGRPASVHPCAGVCGVFSEKHCECVAGTLHSKQTTATETFSPFPHNPFFLSGQVSRTRTNTHTQLKDLRLKLKAATCAAPSAVASMSSSSALASPGGTGVKGVGAGAYAQHNGLATAGGQICSQCTSMCREVEDIEHRCTLQVSIYSTGARRRRALAQLRRAHSGYLCTLAAVHLFFFPDSKNCTDECSIPSFSLSVQGRYSLKVSISPCNFLCISEDGVFRCVWMSAHVPPQKCDVRHSTQWHSRKNRKQIGRGDDVCI